MRDLLPLIMQQLQNNPELMSQFGLGGLSGLNGLGGDGSATGLPGGTGTGTANIPGLSEAIAKALAKQNGGAGVAPGHGFALGPMSTQIGVAWLRSGHDFHFTFMTAKIYVRPFCTTICAMFIVV